MLSIIAVSITLYPWSTSLQRAHGSQRRPKNSAFFLATPHKPDRVAPMTVAQISEMHMALLKFITEPPKDGFRHTASWISSALRDSRENSNDGPFLDLSKGPVTPPTDVFSLLVNQNEPITFVLQGVIR